MQNLSLSFDLEEISIAAQFVIDNLSNHKIILLDGDMGAGKTTLTKAICKLLGVKDHVSSPTFSLVNEYRDRDDKPIYHFDFYRIDDVNEAIDIGAEEYFYSDNLCLIEWASRVEEIIPSEYILLSLGVEDLQKRKITISYER